MYRWTQENSDSFLARYSHQMFYVIRREIILYLAIVMSDHAVLRRFASVRPVTSLPIV